MPIPDRLKLKPVNKTRLKQMSELCDQIERELEAGEPAEDLLNQWHAHAGRRCEPYEFRTYWKSISKETFVAEALNPPPSLDQDATYAEALAVLEAVSAAALPEAETGYYLGWLEAQFPDANMNDLIFWPDEWFDDASLIRDAGGRFKPEADLSNDQILAYAMARSGRTLPGAPADVVLPFPLPGQK
ncbi:MAG TPA: hypothetical protein VF796_29820 [Humisphaera sp.]